VESERLEGGRLEAVVKKLEGLEGYKVSDREQSADHWLKLTGAGWGEQIGSSGLGFRIEGGKTVVSILHPLFRGVQGGSANDTNKDFSCLPFLFFFFPGMGRILVWRRGWLPHKMLLLAPRRRNSNAVPLRSMMMDFLQGVAEMNIPTANIAKADVEILGLFQL
jgi:hypothetical protein